MKTFYPKMKMLHDITLQTIALKGRALQHIPRQPEDPDQRVQECGAGFVWKIRGCCPFLWLLDRFAPTSTIMTSLKP
jgi:hypothetical protein